MMLYSASKMQGKTPEEKTVEDFDEVIRIFINAKQAARDSNVATITIDVENECNNWIKVFEMIKELHLLRLEDLRSLLKIERMTEEVKARLRERGEDEHTIDEMLKALW